MEKIGKILMDMGIPQQFIDAALSRQAVIKKPLCEILVELGLADPEVIAEAVSKQSGYPYFSPINVVDTSILTSFPLDSITRIGVIPLYEDGTVHIGVTNPSDIKSVDFAKRHFYNRDITLHVVSTLMIEKYSRWKSIPVSEIQKRIETTKDGLLIGTLVLKKAFYDGATDIHFNPGVWMVSFRIDGTLRIIMHFSEETYTQIVNAIFLRSHISENDREMPGDGSFNAGVLDPDLSGVDCRVSVYPVALPDRQERAQSMHIRLLKRSVVGSISLNALGFMPEVQKTLISLVKEAQGMIIVTGPTGSGKSTTLHSMMRHINTFEKNLITIEDPVEYRNPFRVQAQVNELKGFTFSKALRHILRHDPDVILIGEIRDEETAEIVIQSANTGHLVLTTLHSNSAAEATMRLRHLGIDKEDIASEVNAIIAQRLVRGLCPHCKKEDKEKLNLIKDSGFNAEVIYRKSESGCGYCSHIGYKGRKPIVEILIFDDEVVGAILYKDVFAIKRLMKERGNIFMDGLRLVAEGYTSVDEVRSVVKSV
ncbi:MAG: type II/IV secretion system protein [Nitrospirota bacterium]